MRFTGRLKVERGKPAAHSESTVNDLAAPPGGKSGSGKSAAKIRRKLLRVPCCSWYVLFCRSRKQGRRVGMDEGLAPATRRRLNDSRPRRPSGARGKNF